MSQPNKTVSYISAVFAGLLVFALLFAFVDPDQVFEAAKRVDPLLLAVAMIPLSLEVICTSLRVQHCVNRPVPFSLAMYSNAIYMTWLSILPARLGELAGIAVFNSRLGMPMGSAIASVVVQRIYDVLILSGLLVAMLSQTLYGGTTGFVIACIVLFVLISVLLTLPFWLSQIARLLISFRHRAILKRLLFVCLQARTWYRHQSAPRAITWLAGTTLAKWIVNLIAVYIVFRACGIELDGYLITTVGILMHFLGAIPVQSFGGFGASDVGLAGILASLNVSAELAVATSIIFRLVVLSFVGLFFTFCFTLIRPQLNQEIHRNS